MKARPSKSEDVGDFSPPEGGRIFSLAKNWPNLVSVLSKLKTVATIYRSPHVLLCRRGRFGEAEIAGDSAFRLQEGQGDSIRTELWHEGFLYEEVQNGHRRTCLEMIDDHGRGFLKLCYGSEEDTELDLPLLHGLLNEQEDEWSLLHVRRANVLDCGCVHRRRKSHRDSSLFRQHLVCIFNEAQQRRAAMGIIIPNDPATTWEQFTPDRVMSDGCWLTIASGESTLHLRLTHFHKAQVVSCSTRAVMMFYDEEGEAIFTMIEPEGGRMKSVEAFEKVLARR